MNSEPVNAYRGFTPLERNPRNLPRKRPQVLRGLWRGEKINKFVWGLKFRPNFLTGFTLIEMLLVLVILGGATSLVLPYLGNLYEKTRFKAEVREISAIFRQVRNKAITQKKIFCIQIDLDERILKYGVYKRAQLKENWFSSSYEMPEHIKRVSYFAEGSEYFSGKVWFAFYSLGSSGGGELRFYGPKKYIFNMTLKPITGAIILSEERA